MAAAVEDKKASKKVKKQKRKIAQKFLPIAQKKRKISLFFISFLNLFSFRSLKNLKKPQKPVSLAKKKPQREKKNSAPRRTEKDNIN